MSGDWPADYIRLRTASLQRLVEAGAAQRSEVLADLFYLCGLAAGYALDAHEPGGEAWTMCQLMPDVNWPEFRQRAVTYRSEK